MQVQSRRGRACQPCRRRKIKCGEQTPTCQQCITSKIECSGPITGPLIVQVNPQRGRRQYRQGESGHSGKDKAPLARDPGPAAPVKDRDGESPSEPVSPSPDAISDRQVIFSALVSKFQEIVWVPHQRHNSVVSYLVDYARAGHLPKLQRSIGAVSLAMTGIATENQGLLHEGQKLYGGTLKALIKGMLNSSEQDRVAAGEQPGSPIGMEIIALSVVCVWYEAISSTTSSKGWVEHSWGAGRLLLTNPPEACTTGMAHAVFRTLRYMVANVSLVTAEPTPFALDPWLHVPFTSCPKGPFDRLVDFMLVIPVCLKLLDQLLTAGLPIPATVEVETMQQKVLQLNEQLNLWWRDFQESYEKKGEQTYIDIEDDFEDASGIYHPAIRQFQSDHAFECVSHYATSRLIVTLMSANLATAADQPFYRAEALTYSALALSATAFADAKSTTGGIREYLGMSVTHILIFCVTPSRSHRAYTKQRLNKWADPGGHRSIPGTEEAFVDRWRNLTTVWDDRDS